MVKRDGLGSVGEIIILIGAILETIFHVAMIFFTFFVWLIPAAIIIPLLWVARNQSVNNDSKGWMIYGIVHGALTGWVTLIGYILLLIDKIQREKVIE